jgi:hypothetical protein
MPARSPDQPLRVLQRPSAAETAPSAKRLGGLSPRNLNFSFAFFKVRPFVTVL